MRWQIVPYLHDLGITHCYRLTVVSGQSWKHAWL